MSRPLPANLKRVYALFGKETADEIHDGHSFRVDGVDFVSGYRPESTPDRFYIVKSAELIAIYEMLFAALAPERVFELGIAEGGSTAWMALALPRLERLVAIDNEEHRLDALDEFVSSRQLEDRVRTFYGVDQGDRGAITQLLESEFPGKKLDLVIDDASHLYVQTRASFECLFPALREGGWYVIEDWAQQFQFMEGVRRAAAERGEPTPEPSRNADESAAPPGPEPLSRLGLELAAVLGAGSGIIDRLEMNTEFVAVRRGPTPVDAGGFRLHDLLAPERAVRLLRPRRDQQ